MSNLTSTARARIVLATTPDIYNLSMPLANTEYSQVLSDGTKQLLIRMRDSAEARISFVVGGTLIKYVTIKENCVYADINLDLVGVTIYLQSSAASQVAEIREWT